MTTTSTPHSFIQKASVCQLSSDRGFTLVDLPNQPISIPILLVFLCPPNIEVSRTIHFQTLGTRYISTKHIYFDKKRIPSHGELQREIDQALLWQRELKGNNVHEDDYRHTMTRILLDENIDFRRVKETMFLDLDRWDAQFNALSQFKVTGTIDQYETLIACPCDKSEFIKIFEAFKDVRMVVIYGHGNSRHLDGWIDSDCLIDHVLMPNKSTLQLVCLQACESLAIANKCEAKSDVSWFGYEKVQDKMDAYNDCVQFLTNHYVMLLSYKDVNKIIDTSTGTILDLGKPYNWEPQEAKKKIKELHKLAFKEAESAFSDFRGRLRGPPINIQAATTTTTSSSSSSS